MATLERGTQKPPHFTFLARPLSTARIRRQLDRHLIGYLLLTPPPLYLSVSYCSSFADDAMTLRCRGGAGGSKMGLRP
jgi:hypothetical protein